MASTSSEGNPSPNPNTSAFPTFLGRDPFPSQRTGRPLSSTASDATSDFDAGPGYKVPSVTGPSGEPGLPPSRPMSRTSGSTEYSQRAGTARASHAMASARRSGRKDASLTQSTTPTVNRSHVPSLTPAGFLRPMSPQRLQAQRGQNVRSSVLDGRPGASSPEGAAEHRRRESNASVKTLQDDLPPDTSNAPPLPVSRGTNYTTSGDILAVGAPSVGSKNSATPLYARQQPGNSHLGAATLSNASPSPLTSRSNRSSLRASLGLASRRSSRKDERRPGPGHEKLPSGPTSPVMVLNEKAASESPQDPSHPKSSNARNHEYFAGNLLFFCSGLFLNTRAKPLNLVTFVLTALPAGMFFGFSAEWLWLHVSPALPIVFAYIFLLSMSNFLHAAFSDPGILPRNLHPHPPDPEEDRDLLAVGPPTTEWVMVKTFAPPKIQPDPSDAENAASSSTTAMEVPTKYCKSCNIWRPPRAHHCRVCDACIETQDHHCVWLNNCVGRRNYRYFFAYVGSGSLLALALAAFSLTHVGLYASQNHVSFSASLTGRTQERVAFAMFLYALLALPYPASLFAYHLFLMSRAETTREYLNSHKFPPRDRHRPFAQTGTFANLRAVLLRPRHPQALEFTGRYVEGDLRLGHTAPAPVRRRAAREKAQESERKVAGMKGRFSLAGRERGAGTTAAKGRATPTSAVLDSNPSPAMLNAPAEMEMSKLPPPQQQQSASSRDAGLGELGPAPGSVRRGLVDRTPRG